MIEIQILLKIRTSYYACLAKIILWDYEFWFSDQRISQLVSWIQIQIPPGTKLVMLYLIALI